MQLQFFIFIFTFGTYAFQFHAMSGNAIVPSDLIEDTSNLKEKVGCTGVSTVCGTQCCPVGAQCINNVKCTCGQSTLDIRSDPKNCGTCGHICANSASCSNGVCGCSATFSNIDIGNCQNILSQHSCTPKCQIGYTISSNIALTCNNGQFTNQPTCSANPCSAIDIHLINGNCQNIASGSTCTPQCVSGYTIDDGTLHHCNAGVFTPNEPHCTESPCHATYQHQDTSTCGTVASGSTCKPGCITGYHITNSVSLTLTCSKGLFTTNEPICSVGAEQPCQATFTNANPVSCGNVPSGSTCFPSCTGSGLAVTPDGPLTCFRGSFTTAQPRCVRVCC